jgi:hypothetical protein
MMTIFKRIRDRETSIHIETRERTIIRPMPAVIDGFCPGCGEQTAFLVPEFAAAEAGLSVREIYRRVERGDVHFSESGAGPALICRNSLFLDVTDVTVADAPMLLTNMEGE